jgi:hypothetical protein
MKNAQRRQQGLPPAFIAVLLKWWERLSVLSDRCREALRVIVIGETVVTCSATAGP